MENQNQIITPKFIVDLFNTLGGDKDFAVGRASEFSKVSSWTAWQMLQTGAVGFAAGAIPVAHLPLILLDVVVLLHKMAFCSWGIGAIYRCKVEAKEDLAIILGLYIGSIKEDALDAAATTGGLTVAGGVVGGVIANVGLPTFMGKMVSKGAGVAAVELVGKLGTKVAGKTIPKVLIASVPVIEAISGSLAQHFTAKLAGKISLKSALNAGAGFAPVLGGIVAGGVNLWFIYKIAEAAEIYYRFKKKMTSS